MTTDKNHYSFKPQEKSRHSFILVDLVLSGRNRRFSWKIQITNIGLIRSRKEQNLKQNLKRINRELTR